MMKGALPPRFLAEHRNDRVKRGRQGEGRGMDSGSGVGMQGWEQNWEWNSRHIENASR